MTASDLIGTSFFGLDLRQLYRRLTSLRRRVSQQQLLLEFDQGLLRYGVGRVRDGQLQVASLGRMELPEEALERGVPTDPEKMAVLVRQLCQEHQIAVNQVSVALPPEAAFVHVVDLPVELSQDEARDQVLDPELGPQLPIPLAQTDFDLVPSSLPVRREGDCLFSRYLLVAIPSDFTTRVVRTAALAELNLQRLEVSSIALLRLQAAQLLHHRRGEFSLLLEMQPGCTHAWILAGSGPVAYRRMVSIRDFPEPELSPEQSALALSESLSGEEITVHDERYLALSELDLRLLITEAREWITAFSENVPDLCWSRCWISGVNSAHPLLDDMLTEALQIQCQRVSPMETEGLAEVGYTRLLLQSGLHRLFGLAFGLLSPEAPQPNAQVDIEHTWQVSSPLIVPPVVEAQLDPLPADDQFLPIQDAPAQIEPELQPEPTISIPLEIKEEPDSLLNHSLDRSKQIAVESDIDKLKEAWPSIPDEPILELPQSLKPLNSEDSSPEKWPTIHQPVAPKQSELSSLSGPLEDEREVSKSLQAKGETKTNESPLGDLRFNDN